MNVIVTVDRNSGFCWGVVRAVDFAEAELSAVDSRSSIVDRQGVDVDSRSLIVDSQNADSDHRPSTIDALRPRLFSLGDIIHNPMEIERLGAEGLATIRHSDFERIAAENKLNGTHTKVLIRAHGEPPSTYEMAKKFGIELIDATCPVVTKVQERIKKFYDKGFQIVIFGKKDHAEVIGLRGVVNDEAIVVKTVAEAMEQVTLDKPTVLFSQTTMDKPTFYAIRDELKSRLKELVVAEMEEDAVEFHAKDTICGQVSGREKKLIEFAQSNDAMIFVAGRTSSNGKVLYEIAKLANPNTYFIEQENELNEDWFNGIKTVGISGATSTPMWLMDRVKDAVYRMCGEPEKAELLPVIS